MKHHLLADPRLLGVLLLAALLALGFLHWAFVPRRHVPRFRVATMRARLRLRLHPGRGFALLPELWARWGRLASFRESRRTRPGLPLWYRAARPSCHAVFLGRAQYRHRLWQTIQENILIIGRSRSGKSGWLARVLIRFHGPVVSATTKPDLFLRTSGLRSRFGRPVCTFNPQGFGDSRAASTIRFDPVAGCQDQAVAMRRGTALTDAVRVKGTEDAGFWNEQAAVQMPALLSAAALDGRSLRDVHRWVLANDTRDAERILRAAGRPDWADCLAQMRGPADKTAATVRMLLVAALRFMNDPALAACVLPGDDDAFDIEQFLFRQGALYLIADQRSDTSPVAPLFACLVGEIHFVACQLAGGMRGERLDPPLLLMLDECTRICPIPAPALLADSGGRGIMMILAAQGLAQIEERWGKPATRSVLDTSNQLYVSGIQDPDTLKMASDLCDVATYQVRGRKDETADYPVATPGMIRRIPRRRALVLRGDLAPVIAHLPMVWHDWRYRWARLRGRGVANLYPARPATCATVPASAQAAPWGSVPVPAQPPLATPTVVNGHRNGSPGGNGSPKFPAWQPRGADGNGSSHPWDRP
jgi:type IV secretory pathway TraG/TraD family ATPase VirD4